MNIYHDSLTRSMTSHLRVIASRRVLSIFQVDGVPLDTADMPDIDSSGPHPSP